MCEKQTIRTCIYCLEQKVFCPRKKHRKNETCQTKFDKEHVIHFAFTEGFKNNLTLKGRVCEFCNNELGKTIDGELTRSSLEAIHRFEFGFKEMSRLNELGRKNLEFSTQSNDPKWKGLKFIFVPGVDGLDQRLIPQIGFPSIEDQSWVFFVEEQIENLDVRELLTEGFDPTQMQIVSATDEEKSRIIARLKAKGLKFEETGTVPPVPMTLFIDYTFGPSLQRAIAKIAFNYFAFACEELCPDLPLSDDFSAAREFIRYGTVPELAIVVPKERPILVGDRVTRRQTDSHLIALEFKREAGRWMLGAQVSLFNDLTHVIILSHDYRGIQPPIEQGHQWDIDSKTISALTRLRSDGAIQIG